MFEKIKKLFSNRLSDKQLVQKLIGAKPKKTFHINVDKLSRSEIDDYLKRIKKSFKKKKFIKPRSRHPKLDIKWSPLSVDDEFWVPTRTNLKTKHKRRSRRRSRRQ